MSSLVMALAGGLLTAILPCHGRSAGICRREGKGAIEEGRFGKRPKGKAASSRRTPKGPSQKMAPTGKKRQESQEGRLQKAGPTTTDFAEWRDWRQVRVVISRRGHDISCPYTRKEKKMPPFPVKTTGTPRQIGRGKRHARKGRRYEGKSAGGTPALQRKAKSQSKDWPLPETENGRVRAGVHGLRLSHFSGRIRML